MKAIISLEEVKHFNSFFNLDLFIKEMDNINFPWVTMGEIVIADILNLSNIKEKERNFLKNLFKSKDRQLINLSIFPLTVGETKYTFKDIDELLLFFNKNEEFQVMPTILFNDNFFLILEHDIAMLFLISSYIDESILNDIENNYSPLEYKEKINYLQNNGFI